MTTEKQTQAEALAAEIKRLAEDMADAACGTEAGAFVERQRRPLHAAADLLASMAASAQPVDPVTKAGVVPGALKDVLMRAGQVIAWSQFGDCRAYGTGPIPSAAEVDAEIRSMLESAPPAPADAKRKPLTDDQIIAATDEIGFSGHGVFIKVARAIEKAHGITPKESTP